MVLRGGTAATASWKTLSLLPPGGVNVTVYSSLQVNPGIGSPSVGLQGFVLRGVRHDRFHLLNQMVFLGHEAVETQMATER